MTREEARKRLEVYLICAQCPEDKECYDSYLHSTCKYNDCREEVSLAEAIRTAIKALEQLTSYERTINKLTEAISEQATILDKIRSEIEHMACRQYEYKLMLDREDVLKVFDKYRGE